MQAFLIDASALIGPIPISNTMDDARRGGEEKECRRHKAGVVCASIDTVPSFTSFSDLECQKR